MKTSTVIFDLGDTLVHYYSASGFRDILRESVEAVSEVIAGEYGVQFTGQDIFARAVEENYENKDHSVRPLISRIRNIFRLDGNISPDLEKKIADMFMAPILARARIYDDTMRFLESLHSSGFRTGIISNSPWGSPSYIWRSELRRLGISGFTDSSTFCGDVGWRKPDLRIFMHALNSLGVRAEECLYVGDNYSADITGGNAAGLRTLLIDRYHSGGREGKTIYSLMEIEKYLDL